MSWETRQSSLSQGPKKFDILSLLSNFTKTPRIGTGLFGLVVQAILGCNVEFRL